MKDKNVVFMGTPNFSVPVLKMLIENTNVIMVVTQPDKEVGRKKVLQYSPVKKVAMENNIPVFQPKKIKNDYNELANLEIDLIVTCAYGQIIPKEVLNLPKYGCINVHASLLPKYRGSAPIQWAILNGDNKTGITIMYMDEGVDTGNIIAAREIPISNVDTLGTLSDKLSKLGSELLLKTLPAIVEGTNFDIPQNSLLATHTKLIKREDERIDFNQSREAVYNQIRSLNPSPLANTLIDGEEWKIVEARVGSDEKGEIGVIDHVYKDGFGINCADGEIVVTRIKPASKKEMAVRDFFNGYDKNKLLGKKVG